MLARVFQKLEDPKRPLLGPNLKALRFVGILLPDNLRTKYLYVFINLMVIVFVAAEYVDIWLNRSELDRVLFNLRSSMSSTFNGFKVMTMYIWQTRWNSIIDYVNNADIHQRKSTDAFNVKIVKKFTVYCRIITYTYWVLIFITGFSIILQPFFKYMTTPIYRHNVNNGTEPGIEIVPCWVPWDKMQLKGYIAASFYQSYATIVGIGWVSAFDTYAIVVLVFFRVELEVLRNDCGFIFGTGETAVDDEEAYRRIKDCHRRYIDLLKYTRLYNACMSPVMLVYMFVCTIMLCVTAYQFTEETSPLKCLLLAEYLVFGVSQLLFYCWHSNEVTFAAPKWRLAITACFWFVFLGKSKDLLLGPYESRWWSSSVRRRKEICMLTHQFRGSIVFTAGPFTHLTVATFINILKGAYSYYTILKQSKHE